MGGALSTKQSQRSSRTAEVRSTRVSTGSVSLTKHISVRASPSLPRLSLGAHRSSANASTDSVQEQVVSSIVGELGETADIIAPPNHSLVLPGSPAAGKSYMSLIAEVSYDGLGPGEARITFHSATAPRCQVATLDHHVPVGHQLRALNLLFPGMSVWLDGERINVANSPKRLCFSHGAEIDVFGGVDGGAGQAPEYTFDKRTKGELVLLGNSTIPVKFHTTSTEWKASAPTNLQLKEGRKTFKKKSGDYSTDVYAAPGAGPNSLQTLSCGESTLSGEAKYAAMQASLESQEVRRRLGLLRLSADGESIQLGAELVKLEDPHLLSKLLQHAAASSWEDPNGADEMATADFSSANAPAAPLSQATLSVHAVEEADEDAQEDAQEAEKAAEKAVQEADEELDTVVDDSQHMDLEPMGGDRDEDAEEDAQEDAEEAEKVVEKAEPSPTPQIKDSAPQRVLEASTPEQVEGSCHTEGGTPILETPPSELQPRPRWFASASPALAGAIAKAKGMASSLLKKVSGPYAPRQLPTQQQPPPNGGPMLLKRSTAPRPSNQPPPPSEPLLKRAQRRPSAANHPPPRPVNSLLSGKNKQAQPPQPSEPQLSEGEGIRGHGHAEVDDLSPLTPPRRMLAAMNAEDNRIVDHLLFGNANLSHEVAMLNNIPVTIEDIHCFRPGIWLKDEPINFYIQMIMVSPACINHTAMLSHSPILSLFPPDTHNK